MSYDREPLSGWALAIVWIIGIGIFIAIMVSISRAEEDCEARGGTPVVDRYNKVRCLEVPEGR